MNYLSCLFNTDLLLSHPINTAPVLKARTVFTQSFPSIFVANIFDVINSQTNPDSFTRPHQKYSLITMTGFLNSCTSIASSFVIRPSKCLVVSADKITFLELDSYLKWSSYQFLWCYYWWYSVLYPSMCVQIGAGHIPHIHISTL